MRREALAAVAVAIGATATGAGDALAALHCVNKPSCVSAGGTARTNLMTAVDAADASAGDDRIEIGPGSYPFPGTAASSSTAGEGLEVVGAGRGATVFEGSGAGGQRVLNTNNADTLVSDFSIALQAVNGTGGINLGAGGRIERVDITGNAGQSSTGLYLRDGADAQDVRVLTPTTPVPTNYGIVVLTNGVGPSELTNVEASARYALTVREGSPVTLRRARIEGRTYGLHVDGGVTVDADGLLVSIAPDSSGYGVSAYSPGGAVADTVINLRHTTIVGSGSGDQFAYDLVQQEDGRQSRIVARNVAVFGIPKDVRMATGGTGTAALDLAYSTARRGPASTTGPVGSYTVIDGPGLIPSPADPGFVDAGGGDFALESTSPYVDAGEPGGLLAGQSPVDLLGNPRLNDGNGDGTVRRDVGAFEYQRPAPPASPPPGTTTQPPPVNGLPPVIVADPIGTLLGLRLPASLRLDRRGRLALPASCPAGPRPCAGRLVVQTASAVAAQRRRRRIVVLGSTRYRVAAGRRARIVVRLSRRNVALVRRLRRVRIRIIASPSDGIGRTTRSATLRPPARRRR